MTTRINRRQFEALLKANPAVRAGSFVTLRWRGQSRANSSLDTPNSLLAGKIQGISGIL